jgi:hypothetical protein
MWEMTGERVKTREKDVWFGPLGKKVQTAMLSKLIEGPDVHQLEVRDCMCATTNDNQGLTRENWR